MFNAWNIYASVSSHEAVSHVLKQYENEHTGIETLRQLSCVFNTNICTILSTCALALLVCSDLEHKRICDSKINNMRDSCTLDIPARVSVCEKCSRRGGCKANSSIIAVEKTSKRKYSLRKGIRYDHQLPIKSQSYESLLRKDSTRSVRKQKSKHQL